MTRPLIALLALVLLVAPARSQSRIEEYCAGDCAVHLFTGIWVSDAMIDIFVHDLIPPWNWSYRYDERLAGVAVSKRFGPVLKVIDVEPELGFAYRSGSEHTQEIWAAIYFRFDDFPWRDVLYTSVGISTGLSYAFDVTELERRKAIESETGSRILHYLSPEISFALPRYPDLELVFRFHHRSGGYGLINDTYGGAQYGTAGLRFRF